MRLFRWVAAALLLSSVPAHAAFDMGTGICETTTTTGTGTLNLDGAYTTGGITYLTFVSQITSGSSVNYTIRSSDGKFEHGTGVLTDAAPDTLSRVGSVVSSDGVGTKLTLPAGTHVVCLQTGEETFAGSKGFQLYTADAGAVGGVLPFWHDSASPADGDIAADIQVWGGADDEKIGSIRMEVDDGATTTEDTQWQFVLRTAGADLTALTLGHADFDGSVIPGWFSHSGVGPYLVMESTNADTFGGYFVGYKNTASPADNDQITGLWGYGKDDGAADTLYGAITLNSSDVTNATEDGVWSFDVMIAGSNVTSMSVGDGVIVGSGTTFPGAGKMVLGTAVPTDSWSETAAISIVGTDGATSRFSLFDFNTTDSQGTSVSFLKSGNATAGSHTIVANNELLGGFDFSGSDGTNFEMAAAIYAYVDGTPNDDSTDMPGRIEFGTTPDGSDSPTTRMTIKNDGGIIIGNGSTSPGAEDLSLEGGDIEFGNAGTAGTNTTLSYSAAGELALEGDAVKHAGKQMFWVPAAAMRNSALNPASCGDTYDSGSNDVTMLVCAFDTGATEENAEFGFAMPKSSNESTITMQVAWTNAAGASTETVQWKIACTGFGDDDALNTAYPADVTVSDTWTAQNDYTLTSETGAITVQNLAEGDYVNCRIGRDTSVDNMTGDALLIGVKVYWTDNASTMAE